MTLTQVVFTVLEVLWVGGMTCWLVLEKRSPAATLAWILALGMLPLIGVPVYLLLGPRRFARKKTRIRRARDRIDDLRARAKVLADEEPRLFQLMRLGGRLDGIGARTATRLELLDDGDATYDAILAAIDGARDHVHCEYYIFYADRSGERFRDALIRARLRGCEVRLLVDGLGTGNLPRAFLRPLREAGVELATFNPILFGRLRRGVAANFRTHRKIVVVDGRIGFTGGINVTDDHSARVRGEEAWRDTHLWIEGAAVQGLQRLFLENWTFAIEKKPRSLSSQTERWFPEVEAGKELVQIVGSGPDQEIRAIQEVYFAAISGAQKRVWITTPYFVPNEPLLGALVNAALRGVDVQLVLPRKTDSPLVDAASRSYHDVLLHAGVKLHLFGPPMVHAKTCVIDDDLAIIGSANLDDRSLKLNFEVVALVYEGPVVAALAALFERDRARSTPRTRRLEAKEPLSERLLQSFARLLAPQL